jgi:hypothetical protein
MRKLGLLALVLGLVIAFAMPAAAFTGEDGKGNRFMLGGTWMTDFGAWNKSKERTGLNTDNTQLMLNVPAHTSLRGFVESGNAGGFFEFGAGTAAGVAAGTDAGNFTVRKMKGYYKFGSCELMAGKDDGWLFSLVPQQRLGANVLTVWDFGFGNFYDGRFTQIRFTQDINKQFRYAISLVAPQAVNETFGATPAVTKTVTATDGTPVTVTSTAAGAGTTRGSYAQIPTLAAKFSLNFGVVNLFPAAAYSVIKWDQLPNGWDDYVQAWYAVLPVKVVAGPFTGLFQAGYGQNIANMLNPGNENNFQVYQRVSSGRVKDTTAFNGFVDLGWTIGPITPHVYFGYDSASNSDAWKVGDNYNQRLSYGAALNYLITPNFMISPEFTIFDFGKRPNTAGTPDIGKDWMAGMQFVFSF